MAFIVKTLAANTLTAAGTTSLYAVPAGKSALVTSVRLTNNGANTPDVTLLVDPSGSAVARRITKQAYALPIGGSMVMEDVVTLGQGDALQIYVSATPNVGWMINGVERE